MEIKTLKKLFELLDKQGTIKDFLIDNLFISDEISNEIYDKDDGMIILVVEAFDRLYISLRSDMIDIPDRCWINADDSVFAASGQDHPFMPTLDGDIWDCGDEVYQVGVWMDEDTMGYAYMPRRYNEETDSYITYFDHKNAMCIPDVKYFDVTEDTANIIWDKYGDRINKNV